MRLPVSTAMMVNGLSRYSLRISPASRCTACSICSGVKRMRSTSSSRRWLMHVENTADTTMGAILRRATLAKSKPYRCSGEKAKRHPSPYPVHEHAVRYQIPLRREPTEWTHSRFKKPNRARPRHVRIHCLDADIIPEEIARRWMWIPPIQIDVFRARRGAEHDLVVAENDDLVDLPPRFRRDMEGDRV